MEGPPVPEIAPQRPVLPPHWLTHQRSHDYAFLVERWRRLARATGMRADVFARAGEHELHCFRTKKLSHAGGIYLSAGIHGDEPASTEALITWAEQNPALLRARPFIFFPCLNPWGLIHNTRFDEQGNDLNRVFHHDEIDMVRNLKALIKPCRFALAIALHEDYDARGLYIYEVKRSAPFWGEDLLAAARSIIPIEGRAKIEGRKATAGLVRRTVNLKRFPMVPEAVYLHLYHSERTFTLETPSEFALDQRVLTHMTLLTECVRRTFGTHEARSGPDF